MGKQKVDLEGIRKEFKTKKSNRNDCVCNNYGRCIRKGYPPFDCPNCKSYRPVEMSVKNDLS